MDDPLEWSNLGSSPYRRLQLYRLALACDPHSLKVGGDAGNLASLNYDSLKLLVFSPSSELLGVHDVSPGAIDFGWCADRLVVAFSDRLEVRDFVGKLIRVIKLPNDLNTDLPIRFFENGVCAFDHLKKKFVFVVDFLFSELALTLSESIPAKVVCFDVLRLETSNPPDVAFACDNKSVGFMEDGIVLAMEFGSEMCSNLKMRPTTDTRSFAVVRKNGALSVLSVEHASGSTKFKTILKFAACEKAGLDVTKLRQLDWCGTDACVLVSYESDSSKVLLVGPKKDWVRFDYSDERVSVFSERDCARIFSATTHEICQRVPRSVRHVLGTGSVHETALAVEALACGEAHRLPLLLKTSEIAADVSLECLAASFEQFDVSAQKTCLKAAVNVKTFVLAFAERKRLTLAIDDGSRTLRVLNMLRHSACALPFTHAQLAAVGTFRLCGRLIEKGFEDAAFSIVSFLRVPYELALTPWAVNTISKDPSRLKEVVDEFKKRACSSEEASLRLWLRENFREEAMALLKAEPDPTNRCFGFLKMNAPDSALMTAIRVRRTRPNLTVECVDRICVEQGFDSTLVFSRLKKRPFAMRYWLRVLRNAGLESDFKEAIASLEDSATASKTYQPPAGHSSDFSALMQAHASNDDAELLKLRKRSTYNSHMDASAALFAMSLSSSAEDVSKACVEKIGALFEDESEASEFQETVMRHVARLS